MFCPYCKNKLNGTEEFCFNCGNKISVSNTEEETTSEILSKKSYNAFKNTKENMKSFFIKYKKICFILLMIVGVLLLFLLLFSILFGFDKLSWDDKYEAYKLKYVSPTVIKLGIKFDNESKIENIKYKTTCGEVEKEDLEFRWNLKESIGKCKITISYKLRKITKEFTVIKYDHNKENLYLDYEIDVDSNEDLDLDGLTNKQEKEYKTDPLLLDSDMDSLSDSYEILTSKTSPTKKDSDGDGLTDYDEIELKLDPLKADSKGDGTKDGNRNLTYNYETSNLKITITGKGNIASTIAEVNSNTKISNKKGFIDNLYTFYTKGTISEADVSITYTDEDLIKYNLKEENLSIYYYNEKQKKYEKIETVIDEKNNTLKATLKHFSNYVVGDSSIVEEEPTAEILFVLDNSWSMYTNEQYEKLTGKKYYGTDLDGFDAEGVRFTLTNKLVTKLSSKNYKIGLSEFRNDYANALKIGSDLKSLTSKLNDMNGKFITKSEGTNITNALNKSISEFSKDSDNKYIVILTDGQDSSLSRNTEKIIENAIESNVKICSIGFGGGSYNVELSNISNSTGCKFYSSSGADGLIELFQNMETELNDSLVDIDGDNDPDGILVADSGFVVNRDGFSFGNYASNLSMGGHCYGMATFAQLYYKKILPLKFDSKVVVNEKSYAYDLTNTYFKKYSNLYDYKLQSNELKYNFGFEYFGEETPIDLYGLDGKTLAITDTYKKQMVDSGMYDITVSETQLTPEEQLDKWGVNYETAENHIFSEDKMQTSNKIKKDDLQMFNAIYAGFIRQDATTHYSSGTDFWLWARTVFGTESVSYKGKNGFINILVSRLNDKDAPVISSEYSNGLHAINAISLIQDVDNPNYYYIGVYDNNYPGEKRYVDIECSETTCATVANDYYSGSRKPIRITPSLEYDLEFYS